MASYSRRFTDGIVSELINLLELQISSRNDTAQKQVKQQRSSLSDTWESQLKLSHQALPAII